MSPNRGVDSRIGRIFAAMSMRGKVLTVSLTVTIAAILLASVVVFAMSWRNVRSDLLMEMRSHAQMLADNSAAALAFGDVQDARKLLSSFQAVEYVEAAGIYRADGQLLAGFQRSRDLAPPPAMLHARGHWFTKDALEIVRQVRIADEEIGVVYIRSDLSKVSFFLEMVLVTLGLATALAVVVSLVLIRWFQTYVTSPITRLADVARRIREQKDFSLRMVRETHDEVGVLAETMNETLEAIALSEQNYREIFNGVKDAIFVQSIEDGRVIDVNKATLEMYQCEREDVVGCTVGHLSDGAAPYDDAHALEKIQATMAEGHQIFEWRAKKKTGELFWVEVNLRFARIGEVDRILCVVRDITERKQAQEMFIQTEKMMSIGGLAAGIAHEINNPLAGILQATDVLEQRMLNRTLPANRRAASEIGVAMELVAKYMEHRNILKMVGAIRDAGMRAADIVANMMSFARKGDTSRSQEDLGDLLDRTVKLAATDYNLRKKYDFRNIEIIREYAAEVPRVFCETGKIQQVILNTLKNGAEAMYEGSEDEMGKAPCFVLRINHEADAGMVRMEIEDNGPGMSREVSKQIFEPFFTTKGPGVGTGLGLSLSYFIISDNHKGTMHVESVPGQGTNFIIRLPVGNPGG